MRRRWQWMLSVCVLSMLGRAGAAEGPRRDLGHEVLATNDGWASLGAGTTGGSLALPEQIYVATNRAEFLAALNDGAALTTSPSTPSAAAKIIYVKDTIDFNVDDTGQPLTFEDRETADDTRPNYFGVLFQVHDGEVDITNASDLVTVSWNRFQHHDKVMLIGSSDSATADRGKLRVTLHHNFFEDVGQRTPRVRFGQVHIYNNYYKVTDAGAYQYSWGVGIESAIYAENNAIRLPAEVTLDRVISRLNGSTIFATGTLVRRDGGGWQAADVIQEWNALNDPDLSTSVGWVPLASLAVEPTDRVPRDVRSGAGPFECDH